MIPACSKCGYELLGIGRQGRCPECGRYFDLNTGEGVRHASDAQDRAEFWLARSRTLGCGCLSVVLFASGLTAWLLTQKFRPMAVLGLIAVVSAIGAVTSYLYERPSE